MNRRKWSSTDYLACDTLLGHDLIVASSNLSSLRSLSVSTPTISQFEKEHDEHPEKVATDESSNDEHDFQDSYNLHTPLFPTKSISRQKKFSRHFKKDDPLIDYYSCAIVVDILLQGFLYVTENHFAFYSNVFGRVTKVLIPFCTVTKITKNKTALIFPNAIRVYTRTEKHVFASLISRDTTYALMYKVWTLCLSKRNKSHLRKENQQNHAQELLAKDKWVKLPAHENAVIDSEFEACHSATLSTPSPIVRDANVNVSNTFFKEFVKSKKNSEKTSVELVEPTASKPYFQDIINSQTSFATISTRKTTNTGDKAIIILLCLAVVILIISALNLYIRVDEITRDTRRQVSIHDRRRNDDDGSVADAHLMQWQQLLHANSANNILHRIDENIEKLHAAYETLESCYIKINQKIEARNPELDINSNG